MRSASSIFPKISIILVFLVMAVVLIVRPWGLLGKAEAAARRTPGLTVNPWRPLTLNERIAAAVALMLAASLPLFAGNYALTVGAEIAIFVIFAASLHFLMSAGGLASFGHAAYFGLGAYGVAFAVKLAGLPMIAALLLGPVLGLLGAAVFGFFAVQLSGVYFAMLTLAFAQIVWSIAFQWVRPHRRRQRHSRRLAGTLGGQPFAFLLAVAGCCGARGRRAADRDVLAVRLCAAGQPGILRCAARPSASTASASSGAPLSSPAPSPELAARCSPISRAACFRMSSAYRSRSMRW